MLLKDAGADDGHYHCPIGRAFSVIEGGDVIHHAADAGRLKKRLIAQLRRVEHILTESGKRIIATARRRRDEGCLWRLYTSGVTMSRTAYAARVPRILWRMGRPAAYSAT